jgi:cytochrome c peroxidase
MAASASVFTVGLMVLNTSNSAAQLPPPPPAVVQLGKALFFDTTLSNPVGQSCASCHNPEAGFTFPVSAINQRTGTVPGAVPTRFGSRKPPTVSYARFIPRGVPTFDTITGKYRGGMFWDGRAADLAVQASSPLLGPNEMNNIVHNLPSPELVVSKIQNGRNANLFRQAYGPNVFQQPATTVFRLATQAIAAWETSPEVSPFSSKYDAYVRRAALLTPSELNGLRLVTGSLTGRPGGPRFKNAECTACHSIPPVAGTVPDLWTNFTYQNVGFPRNPGNPFYTETDSVSNPLGYNPLGFRFVDFGLGDFLYPLHGLPSGDLAQGDPMRLDGLMKVPTLRNVDKRPYLDFVKAYGHNGFFKSLKQLVHFYNTRNLTTAPGEVIDFTKPNPYANLVGRPLWPAPEVPSPHTLVNPTGSRIGPGLHLGNLGLTPQEEDDIVAFLKTLSDANGPPPPPPPPLP